MFRTLPLLLLTGSCADMPEVSAAMGVVSIQRTLQTYELQGRTRDDLAADLQLQRPEGERFTGWTRWRVRWVFEPVITDEGACAVGPVDVELDITQVLPSWRIPHNADGDLVRHWHDYIDALHEHEDHHAELAERAARRIRHTLQSLPAQASCEQMRHEANRIGHVQVRDLRHANHLYDDVTGHGAAQGAIFPGPGMVAQVGNES